MFGKSLLRGLTVKVLLFAIGILLNACLVKTEQGSRSKSYLSASNIALKLQALEDFKVICNNCWSSDLNFDKQDYYPFFIEHYKKDGGELYKTETYYHHYLNYSHLDEKEGYRYSPCEIVISRKALDFMLFRKLRFEVEGEFFTIKSDRSVTRKVLRLKLSPNEKGVYVDSVAFWMGDDDFLKIGVKNLYQVQRNLARSDSHNFYTVTKYGTALYPDKEYTHKEPD